MEKNKIIQRKEEELNEKIVLLEKANREIQLTMAKVEAATQAKTDFLSVMSHEVRTPLNAIIGLSEWLSIDSPKPHQKANLKNLLFSSKHLLNLLNDILDYNKIEENQLHLEEKHFHLYEIIKSNLASFSTIAKDKGLELRQSLESIQDIYLISDATRLVQILTNLLSNAIKFTQTGHVNLSVRCLEQTNNTVLIRFEVSDTGIGIPKDQHELIFERFTQANGKEKNQYGGSGLGLAITKKLIELFDSHIYLNSQPGKGSNFQFDIQFKKGSALSPSSSNQLSPNPKLLNRVNIWVAEDNEINALILGQFLKKWGTQFEIFDNGKLLLSHLEEPENSLPDLILMDLHMPEMGGLEASKKIRNTGIEIPILALSANYLEDVEEDILEAGMDGFIPKPFDHLDLFETLKSYCPPEKVR
jgi:CheY-like chemotaxis protein/nitrogen-specific signal transduction histidine kinase